MKATLYHRSKHLSADALVDARAACPICGCDAPRRAVGIIQRDPVVELLACPACGGCSASDLPTPAVLDAYYGDYYHDDGPRITFAEIDGFAANVLRSVDLSTLGPRVELLDFGGGDGTLALAVAARLLRDQPDRRVHVVLVDYQPPRPSDDPRITVAHHAQLDGVAGSFDLVLASAILEHVPDLRPTLDRLFDLLSPGGWMYARTPYVAPFKRLLPRLDITYPAHVHDLGPAFWNRLPRTLNLPLRIVASRPSMIESRLGVHPLRTTFAWAMKLPARVELVLRPGPRTPWWRLVGGWEVVMRRAGD